MKRSIKHLPKRTQEELNVLLELVLQKVKGCKMVILYGSYARGGYVLWDERFDFGIHTTFQSDYDILIVVEKGNTALLERVLRDKVTDKYEKIFKDRPRDPTPPQFIVETIYNLNKKLILGQYFFTDIVKEGIKIYDTNDHKLEKAKKLSYNEIKEIAVDEFDIFYPDANIFLETGDSHLNKEYYKIGSFELHQACERYYTAISLVFTNYRPRTHDLKKLFARVKSYSRELSIVFPENTDFEKRCYDLIWRAYIEARYNKNFIITKEELVYMIERTKILKDITERICNEKLKSYDLLIEQEQEQEQEQK